MKKLIIHILYCFLAVVLTFSAFFVGLPELHAADDDALDGDVEESELGESESEVKCLRDSDCEDGMICRDIGVCVSGKCTKDADCKADGFYCREDNICAPEVCVYDRDCMRDQFCDNGVCLTTPGEKGYPYVEGGSPNCNSTGTIPAADVLLLIFAFLAVSAFRRFER